jgi:SAM-dependent methyltransferase
MGSGKKQRHKPQQPRMADTADRHQLYEAAVQNAAAECEFIEQTFRGIRGRPPRVLREDFCGTANISSHWVRRHRDNRATGVDLDGAVLDWGREHHVEPLKPAERARVTLVQGDVLRARSEPADVVGAFNFSYWVFKTRPELKRYFRAARRALAPGGLFFLDCFGGYDAFRELEEPRKCKGFTYIWDQARYRPVTGEILCHIHFGFPDGSRMDRAFSYDWRLWSLPEIRELLHEAGFANVEVYWEGTERDGSGDGKFSPEAHGEADAGWIAYLVAGE